MWRHQWLRPAGVVEWPDGTVTSRYAFTHALLKQVLYQRLIMDWILSMPLSLEWSKYWLAQRELGRARMEAERLCLMASMPGERTYLALGRWMLAKIALAEGEGDRAKAELSRALDVLEEAEAPLAAWQVYALAAEFHEGEGGEGRLRVTGPKVPQSSANSQAPWIQGTRCGTRCSLPLLCAQCLVVGGNVMSKINQEI